MKVYYNSFITEKSAISYHRPLTFTAHQNWNIRLM